MGYMFPNYTSLLLVLVLDMPTIILASFKVKTLIIFYFSNAVS